jgi:LacI family transcriptional regulator
MSITTDIIAKKAGLSRQTVSAVLNNRAHLFKAETRDRVLRVCDELGYKPNGVASALREGKFNAIGLIASSRQYLGVVASSAVEGIHAALQGRNWHLVSGRYDDEQLIRDGVVPKLLRQLLVDGLIINYTHDMPARLGQLIDAQRTPAVWINTREVGRDTVRPDDFQGARLATEFLLRRGHRRVAFFNPVHPETLIRGGDVHYHVMDRFAGYEAAMTQAGLSPELIARPERSGPGDGPQVVDLSFLQSSDAPTAALAHSGQCVLPLLVESRVRQLSGRPALEVAAFVDSESDLTDTPVHRVVVPHRAVGSAAVEMLARRILNPSEHLTNSVLPCALLPSASSLPPQQQT